MAKRRMFSTEFLQSDRFSDLPFSCQVLYFNLMASADDDGFISGPKRIMRGCSCHEEDLKYLVKAGYLIVFDSGIVVIRHWLIHNHIRKDRHTETVHTEEKAQLELKNGVYTWREGVENKQNTGAEKAKPALKSDVYVCREETEENPIEPVEKTKEEPFSFPKEWENIAESPQVIENDNRVSQWQDQNPPAVINPFSGRYFEDPELNDLFSDFLFLRKELGCRDIPQLIQLLVIELSDYTTEQQKKILRDALYHRRKDLYPWEITKQMAEDASFTPDGWIESLSDVPDDPDNLDYSQQTCDTCETMTSGFVSAGDILSENDFWA